MSASDPDLDSDTSPRLGSHLGSDLTLGSGIQICHCFWLPRDGSLDTAYGQFDCCAEMAEPIKMLFDVRTWMSPMVGSQISQEKGAILGAISQPIVKYTEYLA